MGTCCGDGKEGGGGGGGGGIGGTAGGEEGESEGMDRHRRAEARQGRSCGTSGVGGVIEVVEIEEAAAGDSGHLPPRRTEAQVGWERAKAEDSVVAVMVSWGTLRSVPRRPEPQGAPLLRVTLLPLCCVSWCLGHEGTVSRIQRE